MRRWLVILLILSLAAVGVCAEFKADYLINNFTAGEISPLLDYRGDLQKYHNGLLECKNALPMPYGGVTRRPGFEYIASATNADKTSRLIPFQFSTEQAYMLEFSDLTMRVFMNGGQVYGVDSYTKLLLHANGSDASTIFTDDGVTTHTITAVGNAQIDTAQKKFGTASGLFDGTGDYLSAADHADWFMSTGVFTIDFWCMFTNLGSDQPLFQQYLDNDNYIELKWDSFSGSLFFTIYSGGVYNILLTYSWTPVVNTWYHVALIRGWGGNANTWALTINGTEIGSESDTSSWRELAAEFRIGQSQKVLEYLYGNIYEFRVSKGIARWTASFTPPTSEYPADSGSVVYSIVTPYSEGDLADLRFVQSADTMYLVHPSFAPRKLTRTGHTAWTLTELTWTAKTAGVAEAWPPFQAQNTTATTLDPAAVTGNDQVLTASAALFTSDWVGTYIASDNGFYIIDQVTNSTTARCDIIDDLTAHAATTAWSKGAWNVEDGYPSVVTFFEERLVFGNTKNQPQTIWMSNSSDFENFLVSTMAGATAVDTDTVIYTIASDTVDAIKWVRSSRKLLIGTVGGEWWLTGTTTEEPVTPTSILVRRDSSWGSQSVDPVVLGGSVFFIQRQGKNLRNFGYSWEQDAYTSTDLSILAEHLTRNSSFSELAYQQSPYQIIWAITDDGVLVGMTYLKEHDVIGWHKHVTDGTFESIAVIPGSTEDELWAVVNRTIGGSTVRYIERLHSTFTSGTLSDAFYVDSGLTYSGDSTSTITGLDHLEGETVDVFADGLVQTDKTVAAGSITLDSAATVVHAGLHYDTVIRPTKIHVDLSGTTSRGKKQAVKQMTVSLYETVNGLQAGPDSTKLKAVPFPSAYSTALYSGDIQMQFNGDWANQTTFYFLMNAPVPMTILGIVPQININE